MFGFMDRFADHDRINALERENANLHREIEVLKTMQSKMTIDDAVLETMRNLRREKAELQNQVNALELENTSLRDERNEVVKTVDDLQTDFVSLRVDLLNAYKTLGGAPLITAGSKQTYTEISPGLASRKMTGYSDYDAAKYFAALAQVGTPSTEISHHEEPVKSLQERISEIKEKYKIHDKSEQLDAEAKLFWGNGNGNSKQD